MAHQKNNALSFHSTSFLIRIQIKEKFSISIVFIHTNHMISAISWLFRTINNSLLSTCYEQTIAMEKTKMILESNVSYFYSQQKSSLSYFVFELHIFINMKKKLVNNNSNLANKKLYSIC